ncbi:uncharacterized protein LOC129636657 isoform X3 [Bubalus kerabau]|uniref:uncharacterized protein LOC129636657 isoform X3 n=1 Tax=Bubalus carabanensis TaxID=3119969 RepID=UPI00244EDEB3|nr:uncharacterized protein LOC129636657 isoform X3 [Bubalus carabanensis]
MPGLLRSDRGGLSVSSPSGERKDACSLPPHFWGPLDRPLWKEPVPVAAGAALLTGSLNPEDYLHAFGSLHPFVRDVENVGTVGGTLKTLVMLSRPSACCPSLSPRSLPALQGLGLQEADAWSSLLRGLQWTDRLHAREVPSTWLSLHPAMP